MGAAGAWKRVRPAEDPDSPIHLETIDSTVVGSRAGSIPHSYSANFTATDLAYAKLRGSAAWDDEPATASRVPRMQRVNGHKRSCNDLLLAFISGAVLAYLLIQFGGQAGTELLLRQHALTHLPQDGALCQQSYVPQGTALSPMALGNLTGNPLATTDRLIIAARHAEDTSWLDVYLSDIPHVVYQVDDPEMTRGALHRTVRNKGNEAMAYLQFIIDYYDRLPQSMVFLHGHRGTWHMSDHVPLLRRLKWGSAGYANLRYAPGARLEWMCGNKTTDPMFTGFNCDWVGGRMQLTGMQPRKQGDITVMNKDEWGDSMELQSVWGQMYEQELGPAPPVLAAPCCAEFMVSRERILAHPRSFYIHLRDWIDETEVSSLWKPCSTAKTPRATRYRTGREFEYVWHYMFGEPAVIEPKLECELLYCDEEQRAASDAALRLSGRANPPADTPTAQTSGNRKMG